MVENENIKIKEFQNNAILFKKENEIPNNIYLIFVICTQMVIQMCFFFKFLIKKFY